jgi:uncharacterized protein YjbJ (UPF0337 family)
MFAVRFFGCGEAEGSKSRRMMAFKSLQRRPQYETGTKNEIAGNVHEVKGTIKAKAGQLTNDPDLEGAGIGEKIAGKVQEKIGQVQKVVEKP